MPPSPYVLCVMRVWYHIHVMCPYLCFLVIQSQASCLRTPTDCTLCHVIRGTVLLVTLYQYQATRKHLLIDIMYTHSLWNKGFLYFWCFLPSLSSTEATVKLSENADRLQIMPDLLNWFDLGLLESGLGPMESRANSFLLYCNGERTGCVWFVDKLFRCTTVHTAPF